MSDYYLNRGKARYYLAQFKEAQDDFHTVQKMIPLGMETQSFIQQYSTNFQDHETAKNVENSQNLQKLKFEKKHRNSEHKTEKVVKILDFNSTAKTAFRVESKNSLPKVRQNNYQNCYQNDHSIPQNVLSSNFLRPVIKSGAMPFKNNQGMVLLVE